MEGQIFSFIYNKNKVKSTDRDDNIPRLQTLSYLFVPQCTVINPKEIGHREPILSHEDPFE